MIVAAGRLRAHVSLKPDVPSEIAVPAGNKIFLVAHTKDGVQIYKCTATPNGATPFSWVFVAPRATLVGDNGKVIGTHFAGPTWEAKDGSKVTGSVLGRHPDPLPAGATDIQLLLLKATPTPVGADGGRLGKTTFIQRLATKGGVIPPAAECDAAAAAAGKEKDVKYSADYYFWKATGKPSA